MAETRSWMRRAPIRGQLAAVVALALAGTAGAAPALAKSPAGSVQGWLGGGTAWPQRALVLFAPSGTPVNTSTVHVTESGVRARGLSITSLRQANPGDLGVVAVVDQSSSMGGAALSAALRAVRSLAASRSGQQQLGVVTFASQPRLFMPLTSSAATIGRVLSGVPVTDNGADVPSAIKLGLAELANANVALGAIIVVSDGVGNLAGSGLTTQAAVKAAAAAANVPVFTVGLQDQASSRSSLRALAGVAPGQFVAASPARLAAVFSEIYSTVTRGYVARWHSSAAPGRTVAVRATVAGAAGAVQASYQAPGSAPGSSPAKPTQPAARRLTAPDVSLSSIAKLSPSPGFAVASPVVPATATPLTSSSAGSFWNTPGAIMAVAAVCGLLLAMALAMVFYRPGKRAVRTRVGSFLPGPAEVEGEELLALAPSSGGLIKRIEHSTWWHPYVENVEISGSAHSPIDLVKRAAALGMVLAVVVTVVSGSVVVGLAPLVLWPFALRKAMARSADKQREKFRDTLPGYLQDMASAMRVGRSFVGGLTSIVETADQPVRGAFERAITDEAFGRPLEEALDAVAERMQAKDLTQVALIAGLNRRSGSNVSEALDRVAEGARERADLRREVKALTGQARMSSWVLTALPGFLLIAMNVVSPLYAKPLLHTTLGIVLLGVGAAMVFAGYKVMTKITNVEP